MPRDFRKSSRPNRAAFQTRGLKSLRRRARYTPSSMKIACLFATIVVGSAVTAIAQGNGRSGSGPKFDVVSIKRLAAGSGGSSQTMSPDTYYRAPVRALELIWEAFGTQRFR